MPRLKRAIAAVALPGKKWIRRLQLVRLRGIQRLGRHDVEGFGRSHSRSERSSPLERLNPYPSSQHRFSSLSARSLPFDAGVHATGVELPSESSSFEDTQTDSQIDSHFPSPACSLTSLRLSQGVRGSLGLPPERLFCCWKSVPPRRENLIFCVSCRQLRGKHA